VNLSSYLKYSGGILLIIFLLYWIQSNLLPTPDIPTGLRIGDYGLIGGVAFWIERTIKFIKGLFSNSKESKKSKKNIKSPEYIKVDKKLFKSLLIVLGIIVIFYFGYNLGTANNSVANEDSVIEDEYLTKVKEPEYSGEYEYLYAYPNGNNLWDTSLSPMTSPQIITIAKRRVGESKIRTEYRFNGITYELSSLEGVANTKGYTLHNLFRKNPSIEIIFTE